MKQMYINGALVEFKSNGAETEFWLKWPKNAWTRLDIVETEEAKGAEAKQ